MIGHKAALPFNILGHQHYEMDVNAPCRSTDVSIMIEHKMPTVPRTSAFSCIKRPKVRRASASAYTNGGSVAVGHKNALKSFGS